MSEINYARIVIADSGQAMVAIRDAGLPLGPPLELRLNPDNSFELFQNGQRIGHVENTPPEALAALAEAASVILAEIAPSGPVRFHPRVTVVGR